MQYNSKMRQYNVITDLHTDTKWRRHKVNLRQAVTETVTAKDALHQSTKEKTWTILENTAKSSKRWCANKRCGTTSPLFFLVTSSHFLFSPFHGIRHKETEYGRSLTRRGNDRQSRARWNKTTGTGNSDRHRMRNRESETHRTRALQIRGQRRC